MAADLLDSVYATREGWTEVPPRADGEQYRYSVREVDGRKQYFTEVIIPFPGVVAEALCARFLGEWTWWKHGSYQTVRRGPDGTIDFVFWPSPTPVVKLVCGMAPPRRLPDGATRLAASMRGTAEGTYAFDIQSIAGGSQLTSRQFGVPQGLIPALMGMDRFAKAHILSEIGEFSFPLPKGSGFVGLKAALARPGRD